MKKLTASYGARVRGSVFKMEFRVLAKGQIISKGLFGILGFFQKTNARIRF